MDARVWKTDESVCKCCFVSSGCSSALGSIESKIIRQEGQEDRRPVTNFLLLDMLEP
jgi:hypothetical protein